MSGAETERAAIVAWLRNPATAIALCDGELFHDGGSLTDESAERLGCTSWTLAKAADALKRGDHLTPKGKS